MRRKRSFHSLAGSADATRGGNGWLLRPFDVSDEVLVAADRKFLYFAFKVYDRTPEAIEALQTRPFSGLGLDDQVIVELDPYVSHREVSSYSVNAAGGQDESIKTQYRDPPVILGSHRSDMGPDPEAYRRARTAGNQEEEGGFG